MTRFHVCWNYVIPATDLQWRYFRFVYLTDPVGCGDVKVATIQHSTHSGSFFITWEDVPDDAPFDRVVAVPHYKAAQDYLQKHVSHWWRNYAKASVAN